MSRESIDRIFGAVGLIAVIGVYFLFGLVPSVRAIGVICVVGGALSWAEGQIPYGIEGREPIGHLQGISARIIATAMILLGIFLVTRASFAACAIGWADAAACS